MFTSQLIALIAVFVIFIVLDSIKPLLADILLFLFFLWGMTAFDLSMLQLVFYPIAFLFSLWLRDQTKLQTNTNGVNFSAGAKVKGFGYHLFTIGLGLAMIGLMAFMTTSKGQFLGIATLSIAGAEFTTQATLLFAAAISGALGIIENRLILGVMKAFMDSLNIWPQIFGFIVKLIAMIPFVGPFLAIIPNILLTLFTGMLLPIFPFVTAALIFALFHIVAYKIAFSLMFFAAFVMIIWIVSYFITGQDDTAMNTSHYGWNGWQTMRETVTLSIAHTP